MLALILVTVDFSLFVLGFLLIIIDIIKFKPNREDHSNMKKLPRLGKYAIAASLLALVLLIFISFS